MYMYTNSLKFFFMKFNNRERKGNFKKCSVISKWLFCDNEWNQPGADAADNDDDDDNVMLSGNISCLCSSWRGVIIIIVIHSTLFETTVLNCHII
mgnify:FL=1